MNLKKEVGDNQRQSTNSANNKTIAKNTILLYFRMLLMMGVSLYTSRIILKTLGIVDYGIYSVVGGVVVMFSFLNSAMSSATQRFLSIELGKNDCVQLKKVFSMSVNIHVVIALVILILAETVGLWFLNTKLIIPVDRMNAANWVYQFSVLSFIVGEMNVPYNALIIAHERMNVYAHISIVEVVLKLLIVFMLQKFALDKLKLFAVLTSALSTTILIIYLIYCKRNFNESRYRFFWDGDLFRQLFNHSWWMLFGTGTHLLSTQGVNILVNIFFGVAVNGARGIAYQLQAAVNGFVSNFMTAVQPQIIKAYAKNDMKQMYKLVFFSSKYSFFLLFFIALPVLIETETILAWWLKIVPDHVVLFTRLTIVDLFFITLFPSIASVSQAAGKIKYYQIVIATGFFLTFVFTYVFFRLGYPAYVAFLIMIAMSFLGLFVRLFVLKKQVAFPVNAYIKKVLLRILGVFFLSLPFPLFASYHVLQPVLRFFAVGFGSVLSITLAIWLIGIEENEKHFLKTRFIQIINKSK